MDAILNSRKRCGVANTCRLIRGRWNREERCRRRRIAEAKQQQLWRLLEAAWNLPAIEGVGKPASACGTHVARSARSTDALCFSS